MKLIDDDRVRRYAMATVATETATIRVTRETRDLLARQAQERGVSVASMLARLAQEAERQAMFLSEREARVLDAKNPAVRAEELDWETTLGDGID
jgi:hypothetical protein